MFSEASSWLCGAGCRVILTCSCCLTLGVFRMKKLKVVSCQKMSKKPLTLKVMLGLKKVAWKTWGSKKPPPVLFACPRCRTFRKDLWSFGQCQGLDRGVPDSTLQKWKALSSNPSVRTALCSTWGVSVVQASKSSFSMETGFD